MAKFDRIWIELSPIYITRITHAPDARPKRTRETKYRRRLAPGGLSRAQVLVHPLRNWFKNATRRDLPPIRTYGNKPPRYLPRASPPFGVMGELRLAPVSQRWFRMNYAGETSKKNARWAERPFVHDIDWISELR